MVETINQLELGQFMGTVKETLEQVKERLDKGDDIFKSVNDQMIKLNSGVDALRAQHGGFEARLKKIEDAMSAMAARRQTIWPWWRRCLTLAVKYTALIFGVSIALWVAQHVFHLDPVKLIASGLFK